MKRLGNLPAISLGLVLAACLLGWFLTRDAGQVLVASKSVNNKQTSLIDLRLMQTAQQMAAFGETPAEQVLSREALRLADHELDQAFATALREATTPVAPATGPLKQLNDKITQIKTRIAAEQQRIAQLTKDAADKDSALAEAELAKAQMALDQDELEDAQQDLSKLGGNEHARLERALQEHEAAQQVSQPPKASNTGTATMADQVRYWFALTDRYHQAVAARIQAASKASTLDREHDALERLVTKQPPPAAAASSGENADEDEDTSVVVARLQHLGDQRKTLTEFDKRIQDCQQLADVYQRWTTLLEDRRRGVIHLLLRSLAEIICIVLVVLFAERGIRRAFRVPKTDHRRAHQLRMMATIAVQVVGVLAGLLIIFGPPAQMTTILGLATAGLTVVLKDFIVAFFGWFTLMGKNGIHLGDWVEIEGVGGEVIEIGVLKTVLLEMGNWTNSGHPTGRHVSFSNSFATEGHYFNFSTAGQWLWDELQVMLPSTGDPYQMAEEIRQTVERETEVDARQAELDWERVTHQYGTRTFSAKPSVDLKPSINRLDVNVRYITRAPQRYEVKSRLFQKIVEMLHQSSTAQKIS